MSNFPANYAHAFFAVPLFLVFSIVSIRSYVKTHNQVTLYLGAAAFCYAVTLLMSGFLAIFTQNSSVLTIGMMIGGAFEPAAGIILWSLVAHIYAPKSDFIRGVVIALSSVFAVLIVILAFRDLSHTPVTLIQKGDWSILYSPVSREYAIVLSIQYISSFFLAIAFWMQSRHTSTLRDRVRLRVLSGMFAAIFVVMGLLPFSSAGSDGVLTIAQSMQLMVGISLLGIFMAITFFIRPDKKT